SLIDPGRTLLHQLCDEVKQVERTLAIRRYDRWRIERATFALAHDRRYAAERTVTAHIALRMLSQRVRNQLPRLFRSDYGTVSVLEDIPDPEIGVTPAFI